MVEKKNGVPVVRLGQSKTKTKPKPNPKLKAKTKTKAKTKAKAKPAPKAKTNTKRVTPTPTNTPPRGMAPPPMTETKPRSTLGVKAPAPTPAPTTKPEEHTHAASPSTPTMAATKQERTPSGDTRMVQGATCTWIGTLDEAVDDANQIPVCPHCQGGLLTIAGGEETMHLGFESYELGVYTSVNPPPRPHPGYRRFMEWIRAKSKETCFPGVDVAASAYLDDTGITVDPTR